MGHQASLSVEKAPQVSSEASRPAQVVPERSVTDQVVESLRASGAPLGRQIAVSLAPPELGRVRVVLRSEGDEIRGVVRVESRETLARLERETVGLLARLEESGVPVRRLDLGLDAPPPGDGGQGGLLRDGGQGGGFGGREPPRAAADETPGPQAGHEDTADAEALARGGVDVRV
jgi:hypothetical protein